MGCGAFVHRWLSVKGAAAQLHSGYSVEHETMKTMNAILIVMLVFMSCACRADDTLQSLPPKEYSHLHIVASKPKDPEWAEAMGRLAKVGDAFTLEHLKLLDTEKLDPAEKEILKATLSATRERVAEEDLQTFTKLIQIRFERAAWADLGCNPLEGTLVPWTLGFIKKRVDRPEVMAELKRIESHYVPSVEMKTMFSTMGQRVPSYATRILAAPTAGSENR
jgi:hypothetical protein